MKYKALFLDLDGTTVVLGGMTPSIGVTRAVLAADKKIDVCLATGRILSHALPVVEVLKLSGLCVIANGIQIYNPRDKKVVQEIAINETDVPYVLEVMRKYGLAVRYFDGESDIPYTDDVDPAEILSLYVEGIDKKIADSVITNLTFLPELSAHEMIINSINPDNIGLEIAHIRATKQHGIAEVAKRLHISTKEIIGVGDGYNDFPLLMACGFRVAMENAVPDLKAIADYIAPSVTADGVAHVIEKFIL